MRRFVCFLPIFFAACVADPSGAPDLATADLAGADLFAGPDLAEPADLLLADLTPPPDLAPVPQWVEANKGLTSGNFLGVAPAASGRVYAVSAYRVYRSNNGGAAWFELAPQRFELAAWTAVAVDRGNDDQVIIGDESGRVLLSSDGGLTFDEVIGTGTLPRPTGTIIALAYVAKDRFLALAQDRVYRWDGTRWGDQTSDFTIGSVFAELALDNGNPPVAYVASNHEVKAYNVEDDDWQTLHSGDIASVAGFGVDPTSIFGWIDSAGQMTISFPHDPAREEHTCGRPDPSNHAFFGFGMQLFSSVVFTTDGTYVAYHARDICPIGSSGDAGSWTANFLVPLQLTAEPAHRVNATAQTEDHGALYLATNQTVLQAATIGDPSAWIDRSVGFAAADVANIASMPGVPSQLFAATERGLFVSSDSGGSWSEAATTGANPLPARMPIRQVEAGGGRVVVRTADHRTFYSDDLLQWTAQSPTEANATVAIAIDRAMNNILYRCSSDGVQVASIPNHVWSRSNTNPAEGPVGCKALIVHPTDSSRLYAVDANGMLWFSDNRGTSFSTDGQPRGLSAWAIDARTPGRLLLASGTMLFDVFDGVVSATSKPQNPTTKTIKALAIDPTPSSNTIYLATDDGGMFRSTDGTTFAPYARGLPVARATAIFIDSAEPSVVRVALEHLGVWRNAP